MAGSTEVLVEKGQGQVPGFANVTVDHGVGQIPFRGPAVLHLGEFNDTEGVLQDLLAQPVGFGVGVVGPGRHKHLRTLDRLQEVLLVLPEEPADRAVAGVQGNSGLELGVGAQAENHIAAPTGS